MLCSSYVLNCCSVPSCLCSELFVCTLQYLPLLCLNILGKVENTGNQHFVLNHDIFYPRHMKDIFNLSVISILLFAMALNLGKAEILLSGKFRAVRYCFVYLLYGRAHEGTGLENRRPLIRTIGLAFPRIDYSRCDRIHSCLTLSIVSTMVMWESSHWLGKNIVQGNG